MITHFTSISIYMQTVKDLHFRHNILSLNKTSDDIGTA